MTKLVCHLIVTLNQIFLSTFEIVRFIGVILLVLCALRSNGAQNPSEKVKILIDKAEFFMSEENRLDSALFFASQTLNHKDDLSGEPQLKEKIQLILYKINGRLGIDSLELYHLIELSQIQGAKHGYLPDAVSYRNLGRLGAFFLKTKQYKNSEFFFRKALDVALIIKNELFISGSFNNLGFLAEQRGDIELALEMYDKGLDKLTDHVESKHEKGLLISIQENIARIHMQKGEFLLAEKLLLENNRLLHELNNQKNVFLRTTFQLTSLYDSMGRYSEIPFYLDELSKPINEGVYNPTIQEKVNFNLAWIRYYQLIDKSELAIEKQNEVNELMVDLFEELRGQSEIINQTISNTRLQEINNELESQELKLQNAELENNNKTSILIFVILIGVVGVLVIFFYQKERWH